MSLEPVTSLRRSSPRRSSVTQTHKAFQYPAPVAGLDFMKPLTEMDAKAAIVASNVLTRTYGSEFRAGWLSWSSLIPGEIRTLMPYNPPRGIVGLPATAKLFAACSDGKIYDVTLQTNEVTVPPVSVTIPGQNEPGEFSWTNFATPTGNFLCVCSSGGGYWTYDTTGGWINRTAGISGPGSAFAINFDFVMSWKNRLWFIVDQTADTFFLGTNSITGASSNFDFGPLLIHGGDLKAMASWTVDGGDGIDDKLVLVGAAGDLLIYEGTDPAGAATFRVVGRWFVGSPPNGRRFMSRYGGDLLIVTQFGLIPLSLLLGRQGVIELEDSTASHKVNPLLSDLIRETLLRQYWEVRYVPQIEALFLNAPDGITVKDRQFVMDVNSHGWSTFDGIPMLTCEVYQGALFFGTVDGKVGRCFDRNYAFDGIHTDGTAGKDINVSIQTAFVSPGDSVQLKRMLQMLLTFQAIDKPAVAAQLNTDWSLSDTPGSPIFGGGAQFFWDSALWDQASWEGGKANTFRGWIGVVGLGYFASLRMTARGLPGTVFTNWMLVTESGGIM